MLEPLEAALPSIETADHRRLDDQILPAPRRAQRPGEVVFGFAAGGLRDGFVLRLNIFGAILERQHRFDNVVGRRRPAVCVARFVERDLAERHVFGEAACRQLFVRAREQRQQRAARRIGSTRAAMEPCRNPGTIECVFEHAEVGLRRSQEHRHLIEWHAALGFAQESPGDLDRFPALPGRGEQHH